MEQAGVAQLVEHNVANVVVVGSNPITRSGRLGTDSKRVPAVRWGKELNGLSAIGPKLTS